MTVKDLRDLLAGLNPHTPVMIRDGLFSSWQQPIGIREKENLVSRGAILPAIRVRYIEIVTEECGPPCEPPGGDIGAGPEGDRAA